MRWLSIALLLALTATACAGVYENKTYGYELELGEGWSTTAKPDVSAAILAHAPSGMSVRVSATRRGGALGAPELERLHASDEAALKKRVSTYKNAPFATPATIAGCPVTHYGFVYRDEKGQVTVSRYAAFSRARGAEHVWMKVNAVLPKSALATATPALEKLLASLKWKEAPTAPAVVESAPPVEKPPEVTLEAPAKKVEIPTTTDGATDLSSLMQPMAKKEAKQFEESFKPTQQPRTAEEQARAREMGLGSTFSPGK